MCLLQIKKKTYAEASCLGGRSARLEPNGGGVKATRVESAICVSDGGIGRIVAATEVHRLDVPAHGSGADIPFRFTEWPDSFIHNSTASRLEGLGVVVDAADMVGPT